MCVMLESMQHFISSNTNISFLKQVSKHMFYHNVQSRVQIQMEPLQI